MIVKALAGEKLPVYGAGANVRDWLFVDDHVKALKLVFEAGKQGETYAIGGTCERSNLTVVESLCDILDVLRPLGQARSYRSQISFVADRPGHDARYAIDASKIQRELGWEPVETFETGLARTVQWYLDHEAWWRPILARSDADRRRGMGPG